MPLSAPPIKQAMVIAPEHVEAVSTMSRLIFPAGIKVERTHRVHHEALAACGLVFLIAPEKEFLLQGVRQIRSRFSTALIPLVVATNQNGFGKEFYKLIDILLDYPLEYNAVQEDLHKLCLLARTIQSLPSDGADGPRESCWLSLLRFLSSRGITEIEPHWDIDSREGYSYPLAGAILDCSRDEESSQLELLAETGLLEREFYDKIHICPACRHFQINFREVCPACLQSDITLEEQIHHYMCGYVGPRRKFLQSGFLLCPKCGQKPGHPGVDHDRPSSGHYCNRCGLTFNEPLVTCRCLCCGNSFSPEEAKLRKIFKYRPSPLGLQAAQEGTLSRKRLTELIYRQRGVLDLDLFKKLMEIEINICRRFPRPLCLIRLSIERSRPGNDPVQEYRFWGRLTGGIRKNLRINDLVTWLKKDELLILSIGAKEKKLRNAICRVQKNIASQWPGITLRPAFIPLSSHGENWELLLREISGV